MLGEGQETPSKNNHKYKANTDCQRKEEKEQWYSPISGAKVDTEA